MCVCVCVLLSLCVSVCGTWRERETADTNNQRVAQLHQLGTCAEEQRFLDSLPAAMDKQREERREKVKRERERERKEREGKEREGKERERERKRERKESRYEQSEGRAAPPAWHVR